MKIAVLADTHDNVEKVEKAFEKALAAEAFIHCGDLCSPFVVDRMGKLAGDRPVHVVWGNNEGDVRLICQLASRLSSMVLHGVFAELRLANRSVAIIHYPEVARPLARSGQYDLVCYGHDHTAHHSEVQGCTLLNPGELLGLEGATTFALVNLDDLSVEFVEV